MEEAKQELDLYNSGYTHIKNSVERTNQKIEDIMSGKLKPLMTSSKKEQDKIGGFFPSDQIVIAGRTGTGKTSFVLNWLKDFTNIELNEFYANKIIILFDSWEMPDWRLILRLYSNKLGVSVKEILNYNQPLEMQQFDKIKLIGKEMYGLPIFFNMYSSNVELWYNRKKNIRDKYPDHQIINICDHTRLVTKSSEKTEEALITSLMMKGMRLKNEENMINIFLSQMNRNIESGKADRRDIGNTLPIASDIFGADSVFQCSDIVIGLHRPGMYGLESFEAGRDQFIPTGLDPNNPTLDDNLLIECILKQREGWTGNIVRKHKLAHNLIEDYGI